MTNSDISAYVAAVDAALADLAAEERDELLEDLPLHLADVLADGTRSLTERLGSPATYAAELRAAAGVGPDLETAPRADWRAAIRGRLRLADRRAGAAFGYPRFVDLVRALYPAWWLVRAYLLVELASGATGRDGWRAWVPHFGGSVVAGVVVLAVAIVASVWLGRRTAGTGLMLRSLAVAAGLGLAAYAGFLAHDASDAPAQVTYASYDSGPAVQNVYPVGADGKPLTNVRLFDQDGNPVILGERCLRSNVFNPSTGADPSGNGSITYAIDGSDPGDYTYPLTCPTDPGPFPPGRSPGPLPAQVTQVPTGTPTSPRPTVSPTSPAPAPTPTPTG